ncbi:VirB10/TraB/TrbI family type IV secretion system protein [Proteus mirabilis]
MSEEKPLTAIEIERQMKQQREQQQNDNDDVLLEETKEPKKISLGIEQLRKSKKGRFLLIFIFVLAIIAMSLYYFPSLLRIVFSNDEKEVPQEIVTTGGNQKLTDLGGEIDPFGQNELSDPQIQTQEEGSKKNLVSVSKPIIFSRGLDKSIGNKTVASSQEAGRETALSENKQQNVDKEASSRESQALTQITRLPYDPNLFIPENTSIPCSLDRRFVSTLAGRLTCTIFEDIYSANGNVKLIEKGTVAHLLYKSAFVPSQGQGRVFLLATKMRTRTQPFIDIPLVDTAAAGPLGETGVDGWIDTHFWDRFGGAMMLGMIPDAMQGLNNVAKDNKDNQTDYTANSRQAFAEIAKEAFANSVNIPPTLYKNQGEIIMLITGNDLDFSRIYQLRMK